MWILNDAMCSIYVDVVASNRTYGNLGEIFVLIWWYQLVKLTGKEYYLGLQ